MKEVACAVCGAVYRFAPADIPPAGKTLTCAKCKARIHVAGGGTPAMAGGAGDVIDLADLPAPRRVAAPPGGGRADPLDLAMPSVGLSTQDLGLDLPAPKGPPRGQPDPLTLDSIDLLAPVGPSARGAAPAVGEPIDLPMPGAPIVDLPAPKRAADLPDLPAPKRTPDLPDLPAPKRAGGGDSPPPTPPIPGGARPDLPDLPAPKRAATPPVAKPSALFDDLPAPRGPALGDLPAPKRASTGGGTSLGPGFTDLPAPKRPADASDLLTPKGPSTTDLAPKGPSTTDLAPKGFFADLPQAKGPTPTTSTDVAPKGFFDDLPQSRGAAKGPPAGVSDLPAPVGFFDDLPAPKHAASASIDLEPPRAAPTPAAPRPPAAAPPPAAPPSRFGGAPVDLSPTPSMARAPSLDLDGLDLAPPVDSGGLELESPADSARQVAVSRTSTGTVPPPLELGADTDSLAGLDLPAPNAAPSATAQAAASRGVVSFKPAGADGGADLRMPGAAADLDLAGPSRRDAPAPTPAKAPRAEVAKAAKAPRLSKKTLRLVLAAALGVAVVGGGGFVYYQRWQAKQQHADDVRAALDVARRTMVSGGKNHWTIAANAARAVLQLDRKNPEALGLAAQALIGGYLDEGTERDARLAEAETHIRNVPAGAGRTPAVDKAIALDLLVDGDADAAVNRLQPLVARNDADAALYLGWAQLAAGKWDDAAAAFQKAAKDTPQRAASALYGLARAQLAKGDRTAARATFLQVIAADKEHVGALVGEAEAMPSSDFVQREAALLAILQRKGLETKDPRVVARAWTLAGDDARRAGRLDTARERYRKALQLAPASVEAMVSSASLELRDGKLEAAAELAEQALSLAADDVAANLVNAELDIRRNRLTDAAQRLAALRTRTPPLTGATLGRLHLLDGMRLEAEKESVAALAAYENAGAVLGTDEVEPAIATATLLGRLAKDTADAARAEKDAAKAKALDAQAKSYEDRAKERLGALAAAAEQDPALAVTLGVAYLSAGAAAESELWLRKAIAKRPADVEANFQLAEALRRQNKQDEALATLVKAFELDPTRIDLGVELARGFEAAGRDAEASSLYKRLVDGDTVSLDVRIRAGRFFARSLDIDAARKEAEKILASQPSNAAGLFLRAEGLLADGHADEARRLFQQAADADPDPQFLDGLGRACEAQANRTGDTARRDEALRAYVLASERDPKLLNSLLGRGRLHMARREFQKALPAYEEALRVAPTEPSIPFGIGISYAELGDRANAILWLSRSVKLQPRAEAYFRLGDIYYGMGDKVAPAAQALARATELGLADERAKGVTVPWLTDAYWLLGDVEKALGNDGGVKRAWESYLQRNPPNKVQAEEVRRYMMGLRGR